MNKRVILVLLAVGVALIVGAAVSRVFARQDMVALADLIVGDCVAQDLVGDLKEVKVTECEGSTHVVVGTHTLADSDAYPGIEEVNDVGAEECRAMFEQFHGAAWEQVSANITSTSPNQEAWESGERTIVCFSTEGEQ